MWEGRYKSCVVDEENYLLICQRYIEFNPVRAGMVEDPDDYRWSSYQANGLGKVIKFWRPHRIYRELGDDPEACASAYRELFRGYLDKPILTLIRQATNQDRVWRWVMNDLRKRSSVWRVGELNR